jgi:phage terminase large subunit-like protein
VLSWPFMPWQVGGSDVAGEIDPVTGEWAYSLVVVIVQRQAGKTALVQSTASQRCLTGPDLGAWYTAQKREDARDNWMQLVKRIGRSALRKPVCKVRESNGSETVTFPNGSTYRVFAPVPDALHGKSNVFVCVDEGWAFDELRGDELTQAIVPTFTTVAGQMWVVSAAGHAGSTWLAALRDAGRACVDAGRRSGICYIEYGIDDDTDPTDLAAVAAAHPANGYTLRPQAIADAAVQMKPGEFARAYGNRWTGAPERVIPALLWAKCADETTPLPEPGRVALAFDVGAGDRDAAVCIAWRDNAGRAHIELVDVREGTSWLVPRLTELVRKLRPRLLVYDKFGPAVAAGDAADRARLGVRGTTTEEYTVACSTLLTAIIEGLVGIRPHPALDAAAAAAAKRAVGERWAWGRRASTDSIAGLVAATLALWGYDHAPPPAPRFVVR